MKLEKKRWIILTVCCLINLCLGSIYAWSVFAAPMAEYLTTIKGWEITTGDLAIVYTIANSVGPVTMISGGWFNDRFGPRMVILAGGILFCAGMIASGFATSIPFLIVTYGLIGGLGLGMAYGCTISSCVKFFPDKRGLIGGLTTASYGFTSVILPIVITVIVEQYDVTAAFKIIGTVFLAIITVCSFFAESAPKGFSPEGWLPKKQRKDQMAGRDRDWREMLKSPIFYIMILMLMCGAFSGMMTISQASAVAINMIGLSAAAASAAVSALALFNTFGRIAAGSLSDKIGRVNTLVLACLLSCAGLMLLFVSGTGSVLTFYGGVSIVGLCFGAFMGVFPGFTVDQFGDKNNSVNYGIMFIGFAMAGYFGPTVMKHIYLADRVYQRAFLVAGMLNVIGIVLAVIYKKMAGKEQ